MGLARRGLAAGRGLVEGGEVRGEEDSQERALW